MLQRAIASWCSNPAAQLQRTTWSRIFWGVRRTWSRCKSGWQKNSRARGNPRKPAESEPTQAETTARLGLMGPDWVCLTTPSAIIIGPNVMGGSEHAGPDRELAMQVAKL